MKRTPAACILTARPWYLPYIPAAAWGRVQRRDAAWEVLEPNYCLLLFGTSVLNLRSALRGIAPSSNFKPWVGAGRRRFLNSVKVSPGPWRWEQKWCWCVRSWLLGPVVSLMLFGGLLLAVSTWLSPQHGGRRVEGGSVLCVWVSSFFTVGQILCAGCAAPCNVIWNSASQRVPQENSRLFKAKRNGIVACYSIGAWFALTEGTESASPVSLM